MLCSVFEVQTDGLQANRYRMIQVQMDCKSPLFVKRYKYEQNLCRKQSKSLVFYKLEFLVQPEISVECQMSQLVAKVWRQFYIDILIFKWHFLSHPDVKLESGIYFSTTWILSGDVFRQAQISPCLFLRTTCFLVKLDQMHLTKALLGNPLNLN